MSLNAARKHAERREIFKRLEMHDNGEYWPKLPVTVKVEVWTGAFDPLLVKTVDLPEANDDATGIINLHTKVSAEGYVLWIKILNYDNRRIEIMICGLEEPATADVTPTYEKSLFVDILPILNEEKTEVKVNAIHGIVITLQKKVENQLMPFERSNSVTYPTNFRRMHPPNHDYPLVHATPLTAAFQSSLQLRNHAIIDDLERDNRGVFVGTMKNPFFFNNP